jgi:nucleotidyltransferase/DNA polymerase involved in DNA repair
VKQVVERKLRDLEGIGRAMMEDFALLGVKNVNQLAHEDPDELFDRLCGIRKQKIDVCCLDVFRCAVAQARNPELPPDLRKWWVWSRLRKSDAEKAKAVAAGR